MEFEFAIVDEARDYVAMIVAEMTAIFGVSTTDAVKVLNRHWANFCIDDENLLGHEEPDFWAREIYLQHAEWLLIQQRKDQFKSDS